MRRVRSRTMAHRLGVGEVRQVHEADATVANSIRAACTDSRSRRICRGVRDPSQALQFPWGWHHGAHGVEADSHGDHLALLRVGLAAEEERETKAVVTR